MVTPIENEACPLDLAPTSSTTAALVVGDSLAMTLMKMKGFTSEGFSMNHPGGSLGRRLLTRVTDVMRCGMDNPIVDVSLDFQEMLLEIARQRSGAVSVVYSNYALAGLVTDFDIRVAFSSGLDIYSSSAKDIMNPNPHFVYSDVKAIEALDLMQNREHPFLVLPVVDRSNNQVVGMVHLHDLVAKGI